MNIPDELLVLIRSPLDCGERLISSTRAILYYLGDELAGEEKDKLVPFQAIDSQTDHIQLGEIWPFPLPSPRVSPQASYSDGRLLSSSVHSVYTPSAPGYEKEIFEIMSVFKSTYEDAVSSLLAGPNLEARR
jgi:hypothetical protein